MSEEQTLIRLGLYEQRVDRDGMGSEKFMGYLTSRGFHKDYFTAFDNSNVEGGKNLLEKILAGINKEPEIWQSRRVSKFPFSLRVETFKGPRLAEGALAHIERYESLDAISEFYLQRPGHELPYEASKVVSD